MELDKRKEVVLTLDAGGTSMVFSAIEGGKEIVKPITLPTHAHDLELCLSSIVEGFTQISRGLKKKPSAISFAFPGPADYPNGIIGDLGNLPAFRGGVALGPMLEDVFQIPVFINNDGDLFAYGEAIAGLLPEVNGQLAKRGNARRYRNLLGVTLGTGFGAGIVHNGQLYLGDSSSGAEVWLAHSATLPTYFAEEGISIRAVQREFARITGKDEDAQLSPKDIFDIATGTKYGNVVAAKASFEQLGKVLGDVLANAVTLLDCNVVIGGGLANAYPLFVGAMMEQLNGKLSSFGGGTVDRLEVRAFDLEDPAQSDEFYQSKQRMVTVPQSGREVVYNFAKQMGVGLSRLGTSRAVAIGAYAFAVNAIDSK